MPLSVAERKYRMPFGAQKAISRELQVSAGWICKVMDGAVRAKTPSGRKTVRAIQVAIARKLGVRVDEAFPPTETRAA